MMIELKRKALKSSMMKPINTAIFGTLQMAIRKSRIGGIQKKTSDDSGGLMKISVHRNSAIIITITG
jgi:hypothetical protein